MSTKPTEINESALSWGHPGLDKICQSLKDFDSLLIVFRDATAFKWAQNQARQALIPQSQKAGLYLSEVNLSTTSVSQIETQLQLENPDAIVAISSEPDRDRLNNTCTQLSKLPVAVIGIFQMAPNRWELFFENCVEITEDTAIIRWRDGRSPVQMPFSMTEEAQVKVRQLRDRIVLIGTDDKREKIIRTVLENTQCDIKRTTIDDPSIEGAALVIYEEPWASTETEDEIQKLAALSTVFISSPTPMRAEDRIRCYRAGARLVLSDKAAIEELSAAVSAYLFPRTDKADPFALLDNETRRLSARIRRESMWSKNDKDKVLPLYLPLVANHFRRAQLLDAEVIVMLVKIPTAPKEIAVTGWQNVFQKALVNALVSSLRARDLTFTVDDTLVVVISAVHSIATKPVLKRMQSQLTQMSAPPVSVDILVRKSPLNTDTSDQAQQLLAEVFTPEKFSYKEINKWLSQD